MSVEPQPQAFTTPLSLQEIEERLAGFDNFDIKEKNEDSITVNVGSSAKYRFLGVYITKDYQAPVSIEATEQEDGGSLVVVSRRAPVLVSFPGDGDFFLNAFEEIKQTLDGS